ncbi:MAG: hypothetical protein J5589_08670 [Firmicutes bacterium]|nr:hypothetical protein [Bacillota bacterium]
MDSSDEKRREEIEDWDLDELFFEKEKQIQEAESKHALASAQYEARFKANSDSREVKKSVARKSPVTEELEIPLADDFKNKLEELNFHPEGVQLTSVEPEPSFDAYDGTYDYAYDAEEEPDLPSEPAGQEIRQTAGQTDIQRQAVPDLPPSSIPVVSSEARGAAQNATQMNAQAPVQTPVQPAAKVQVETEASRVKRQRKPIEIPEEFENDEEEDEETPEQKKKKIILYSVLGGIILLLVILIAILLATNNKPSDKQQNSQQSSAVDSTARPTDIHTMTGVVIRMDTNNGTILLYDAEKKTEKSFTLNRKEFPKVSLDNIRIGDIIDLKYDALLDNAPSAINKNKKAETISDVSGVNMTDKQVAIDGKVYTFDDQLICQYQGKDYDRSKITKSTRFDAVVLDGHLYTIRITAATGTFILENLKDYYGAQVKLTPADGEEQSVIINDKEMSFELLEGSVDVEVTMDQKSVYTGKSFVTAGTENRLRLPNIEAKKGKVIFDVSIDDDDVEPVVMVAGRNYGTGTEIDFEYGDYSAMVTAEGYETATVQFKVEQPYQQVTIEMKKKLVKVILSSTPFGVELFVDGIPKGIMQQDGLEMEMEYGEYQFTAFLEGYEPQYRSVTLDKDSGTVYIAFYMEKLPEESSESSVLEESSESSAPPESSKPEESSSAPESSSNDESSEPEPSKPDSSEPESSSESSVESSESSSEDTGESSSESIPESSEEGSEESSDNAESEESTDSTE